MISPLPTRDISRAISCFVKAHSWRRATMPKGPGFCGLGTLPREVRHFETFSLLSRWFIVGNILHFRKLKVDKAPGEASEALTTFVKRQCRGAWRMGTQDLQHSWAHCGVAHDSCFADGLSHWRIGKLMDLVMVSQIPSRKLTYPTLRKGTPSSKSAMVRDMLVPRRVFLLEFFHHLKTLEKMILFWAEHIFGFRWIGNLPRCWCTTVRTETRRSANLGVTHVPGLPNLGGRLFYIHNCQLQRVLYQMPNALWMSFWLRCFILFWILWQIQLLRFWISNQSVSFCCFHIILGNRVTVVASPWGQFPRFQRIGWNGKSEELYS